MSLRAPPPVRSPLTLGAIVAGLVATSRGGQAARAGVSRNLQSIYRPLSHVLTDSGTSALALAIRLAAKRRPGRPILLPGWGCYDLATAADAADVPVTLYDLDPATLGPDWDSLARGLKLEPAAVVAAHFYGLPVDLVRLAPLSREAGAVLISDAAQGAGARLGDRPLGAWGDLAILSFGRGKGMTGGKGGALLAHGDMWADAVSALSLPSTRGAVSEVVKLAAQWLLTRPELYALPANVPWLGLGETVYHRPHPAMGLSALAAGVLDVTIPLADPEAERRRANAAWLTERLGSGRARVIKPLPGSAPGWLRLPVLLSGPIPDMTERVERSLGIYSGYPLALIDLPGFSPRLLSDQPPLPGARELANRLVTLPTHAALNPADLSRLIVWSSTPR